MSANLMTYTPQEALKALRDEGALVDFRDGTFVYRSPLVGLMRALDECFRGLALRLGAEEWEVPVSLSLATALRAGYLERFPQQAWLLAHLGLGEASLGTWPGELANAHGMAGVRKLLRRHSVGPNRIVNPLVCYHVYRSLMATRVTSGVRAVTAASRCLRREPVLDGLLRLIDFRMREIVLIGEALEVSEARSDLVDRVAGIASRWDLPAAVQIASDAFFGAAASELRQIQRLAGLKQELRVRIGPDTELAVGSFNLHGTTFGQRFEIAAAHGPAHTACVGFGIDRWAFAIVCRHGLEPVDWPAELRG